MVLSKIFDLNQIINIFINTKCGFCKTKGLDSSKNQISRMAGNSRALTDGSEITNYNSLILTKSSMELNKTITDSFATTEEILHVRS